jgi:MFS transporter, DHA1 family, 2-module integral membrane pump EmrD
VLDSLSSDEMSMRMEILMARPMTQTDPYFKRMILFLTVMAGITQAGLVLYTPAFVQMSQAFHVSPARIKMTLTAYLFGFAVSQCFYGPLSDRWGRKPILMGAIALFSLGCLWTLYATQYAALMESRVLQGLGIGACLTLSRAILRDCFEGKTYFYAASYLSTGFAIGLGVTPLLGAHLLEVFSWRSEFVCLLGGGLILLIAVMFWLPETRPSTDETSDRSARMPVLRAYVQVLKHPHFLRYLLGGVMAYGVVVAYTTMTPFLFQVTFGLAPSEYAWGTFAIAVAYYASTWCNRKLIHRYEPMHIMRFGLYCILTAGLLMCLTSVFDPHPSVVLFLIWLMLATYGQAFIWSNTIALALQGLSGLAGTASALFSAIQMLLSAVISAVLALPPESTPIPLSLAIVCLGGVSWFVFSSRGQRTPISDVSRTL